jgi:hypothetical protein
MGIQTVLLKEVRNINRNDALDMEDFTAMIHAEYRKTPYYGVGRESDVLALSTSPLSPEDVDILQRVYEIVDEVYEYIVETMDGMLTNENMEISPIPHHMLEDAKLLINKVRWDDKKNSYYIHLNEPLYNSKGWYIKA